MSEQFADTIEAIAKARESTASHVVREILALYFNQAGLLPPRPARPNGQPHEAVHHG
jgi:hypothetical protein